MRSPLSQRRGYGQHICLGRRLHKKSAEANLSNVYARTLSNKPERELISTNNARCAVVASLVGNKLAGQDVEDRALVADDLGVSGFGLGGVSGGGETESDGWWVGAAEVTGENGG